MDFSRRRLMQTGAVLMAAHTVGHAAPNDRIAVGVVGAGVRGQELIEAALRHPGVEIAGLCDAYSGRIERSLDRTGNRPTVFRTHQEMLAGKAIDAVIVATPNHLHHPMVMDSLRAGKDVYCESPLTYRVSEGLEIAKTAQDRGRMLQTGSPGMSSDLQEKARTMISAGWLGSMTTIRAVCNRNTVDGAWIYPVPPNASPKTVDWEIFLGQAPRKPFSLERFFRWRCYQDYSGGIAGDLFVDLCNSIHYLWDVPAPTKVMAMGQLYRWAASREMPDTLNAILEYPRGFVVNLSATFNNIGDTSLQFFGTEGTLKLDSTGLTFEPQEPVEDHHATVQTWPKALEENYYKNSDVIKTEVEAAREKREKDAKERDEAGKNNGKETAVEPELVIRDPENRHHFNPTGVDATVTHLGHFFESVRTRKPHWEDALAGHRAAACAHMINASIREKRMVEWDLQKDTIKS